MSKLNSINLLYNSLKGRKILIRLKMAEGYDRLFDKTRKLIKEEDWGRIVFGFLGGYVLGRAKEIASS